AANNNGAPGQPGSNGSQNHRVKMMRVDNVDVRAAQDGRKLRCPPRKRSPPLNPQNVVRDIGVDWRLDVALGREGAGKQPKALPVAVPEYVVDEIIPVNDVR